MKHLHSGIVALIELSTVYPLQFYPNQILQHRKIRLLEELNVDLPEIRFYKHHLIHLYESSFLYLKLLIKSIS